MANFNDWNTIFKELKKELGREPNNFEMQKKILEENFSDKNKKGNKNENNQNFKI